MHVQAREEKDLKEHALPCKVERQWRMEQREERLSKEKEQEQEWEQERKERMREREEETTNRDKEQKRHGRLWKC